jgi:ribosomal protein S27E
MKLDIFHTSIYLALMLSRSVAGAEPSPADCRARGFDAAAVRCSDCAGFETIVGSTELRDRCLECCTEVTATEGERFELAVLEVDARFAAHVPALQSLMTQAEELGVVVRNRIGARPALLMYRERTDDAPEEEVPVASWSADTVREYLRSHLAPAATQRSSETMTPKTKSSKSAKKSV